MNANSSVLWILMIAPIAVAFGIGYLIGWWRGSLSARSEDKAAAPPETRAAAANDSSRAESAEPAKRSEFEWMPRGGHHSDPNVTD